MKRLKRLKVFFILLQITNNQKTIAMVPENTYKETNEEEDLNYRDLEPSRKRVHLNDKLTLDNAPKHMSIDKEKIEDILIRNKEKFALIRPSKLEKESAEDLDSSIESDFFDDKKEALKLATKISIIKNTDVGENKKNDGKNSKNLKKKTQTEQIINQTICIEDLTIEKLPTTNELRHWQFYTNDNNINSEIKNTINTITINLDFLKEISEKVDTIFLKHVPILFPSTTNSLKSLYIVIDKIKTLDIGGLFALENLTNLKIRNRGIRPHIGTNIGDHIGEIVNSSNSNRNKIVSLYLYRLYLHEKNTQFLLDVLVFLENLIIEGNYTCYGYINYNRLNNLKILTLKSNSIEAGLYINELTQLTELTIDTCGLKELNISKNLELVKVKLISNLISVLDAGNNSKLAILHLEANKFEFINHISCHPKAPLTQFYFFYNKISAHLNTAVLNDNNILCVPVLEYVYLRNCIIKQIDLKFLKKLEFLDLANSLFSQINVSGLPNLKEIIISNNPQLTNIKTSFNNNRNLKKLDLSYNQSLAPDDVEKILSLKNVTYVRLTHSVRGNLAIIARAAKSPTLKVFVFESNNNTILNCFRHKDAQSLFNINLNTLVEFTFPFSEKSKERFKLHLTRGSSIKEGGIDWKNI
jgi:hypothetical protein